MAAAHPFGAFIGCRFRRIGCVRRIKVKETEDGIIPCSSYRYCGFKMGSAASFNEQPYHITYTLSDMLHRHIEEMKERSFK